MKINNRQQESTGLESCSGAGATGTLQGPWGLCRGGYGAYGESAVSGTELHRVTAGRGHTGKFELARSSAA